MLNVTVDMFGNSINLVEIGGRVQGLERIVEKLFGPNGYFSKQNVKELMDNKRQAANYISTFDKAVSYTHHLLAKIYFKIWSKTRCKQNLVPLYCPLVICLTINAAVIV